MRGGDHTEIEKQKRFIINVFYLAIILAIIFLIFKYLLNLVMPFFIALVLAAVMRPLIKFLNRKCHINKNLAAVISMLLLFGVICVLVVAVSAKLVTVIADLISALPALYRESIEPGLVNLMKEIEGLAQYFDDSVVEVVNEALPQVISSIGSAVTNFSVTAVTAISGFATKLPSKLLSGVICVIATVFMTFSFDKMTAFIVRQLPQKAADLARSVKNSLVKIVFLYGRSYALILLITFSEIALGLLIIGFKNWWLIALLIAIFDIFPIVGSGMVLLPWAIITIIQGKTLQGVGLAILYVVVIVVRQIIEPKIIGRHVGLPPIVTLIAMYVGTKLFGGIGLFGLPITMAILVNLNADGTLKIFKLDDEPETVPAPVPVPPAEE